MSFSNDSQDGFYAFNNLCRSFTQTAGLGGIERRDYLTHPKEAKHENEVYDLVLSWERELKEQEKTVPVNCRPLLSPIIKCAVMKKIVHGNIKEYIKTHESIKDYAELRQDVLGMGLFCKNESNIKAQKPQAMECKAVFEKVKQLLGEVTMEANQYPLTWT